jgi:AcrR family transcriptional regulator
MPEDDPTHSPLLDWRQALRQHVISTSDENEGLRERKKRLMRQQISDTATLMFLERGFDEVKITEVAAACGVAEKTIYNYFPTKESLVFDQEDSMSEEIEREMGAGAGHVSPVEAMVTIIKSRLRQLISYAELAGHHDMSMIQRFAELIDRTPSLKTAQMDMTERVAQVAARAMAQRAGIDPDDPEPQIAADSLLGLWRVYFRASFKYAEEGTSLEQFEQSVLDDVQRAARLIDTGLWSFSVAVQGTKSRDQLKIAAEASDEARKKVVSAIKQAKSAWRQIEAELKSQASSEHDTYRTMSDSYKESVRRASQQLRRDSQSMRETAQQTKKDARAARQQIREEIRRQIKDVDPRSKR